jgi:hypothetical protein
MRCSDLSDEVSQLNLCCRILQNLTVDSAQIITHHFQRESTDALRSDSVEMRELLFQILTSHADLRRVVEMQGAGEHVAEPIMEAGQHVGLQRLVILMHDSIQSNRNCAIYAKPLVNGKNY